MLGTAIRRAIRGRSLRAGRVRVRQTPSAASLAIGCSRGGFCTKTHRKTDLDGRPLDFQLAGGKASDDIQFETSLGIGPDIHPRIAVTDKGYISEANRDAVRARGITPVIPRRKNSKHRGRLFPN